MADLPPDNQIKPFSYFYPSFYKGLKLNDSPLVCISEGLFSSVDSRLVMEFGISDISKKYNYFQYKSNIMVLLSKLNSKNLSDFTIEPFPFQELPRSSDMYPTADLGLKRDDSRVAYLSDGRIFVNIEYFQMKDGVSTICDIIDDVYNMQLSFKEIFEASVAKDKTNPKLKSIPGRESYFN